MLPPLDLSSLSLDQRIELAQELWESLHEQVHTACFMESQVQEIRRRLEALDSAQAACESWETLKARLRQRR